MTQIIPHEEEQEITVYITCYIYIYSFSKLHLLNPEGNYSVKTLSSSFNMHCIHAPLVTQVS